MSDLKKYRALRPIGLSGRVEAGETVSLSDEDAAAFAPGFLELIADETPTAEAPAAPEPSAEVPAQPETPTGDAEAPATDGNETASAPEAEAPASDTAA